MNLPMKVEQCQYFERLHETGTHVYTCILVAYLIQTATCCKVVLYIFNVSCHVILVVIIASINYLMAILIIILYNDIKK